MAETIQYNSPPAESDTSACKIWVGGDPYDGWVMRLTDVAERKTDATEHAFYCLGCKCNLNDVVYGVPQDGDVHERHCPRCDRKLEIDGVKTALWMLVATRRRKFQQELKKLVEDGEVNEKKIGRSAVFLVIDLSPHADLAGAFSDPNAAEKLCTERAALGIESWICPLYGCYQSASVEKPPPITVYPEPASAQMIGNE